MASVFDAIASSTAAMEAAEDLGLLDGNINCDVASVSNPPSLENKEDNISQIDVKIMMGRDLEKEFHHNQKKLIKLAKELTAQIPDLQARKLTPEQVRDFGDKFRLAQKFLARNQLIITHCQRMISDD